MVVEAAAVPFHPLIEEVLADSGGLVFKKRLRRDEPVVGDHIIHNMALLPGICQVEMAFGAARAIRREPGMARAVYWLKPIIVREDGVEVQVRLTVKEREIYFEILYDQKVHSRGWLAPAGSPSPGIEQTFSLEAIKARCGYSIERKALYERMRQKGFSYGKTFRGLGGLRGNGVECLGEIRFPRENAFPNYVLHPTIVDSALQSVIGFLFLHEEEAGGQAFMPYGLEKIELINQKKIPTISHVYSTMIPSVKKGLVHFDIHLLDEAGGPVIAITKFCMRVIG